MGKASIKCEFCFDTGVIGFGEHCLVCDAGYAKMEQAHQARNEMPIGVKLLHEDAILPKYAKPGDAGFDFHAIQSEIIEPGCSMVIGTGLAFEIPEGYELQVRPRSGLSIKTKLRIANSPGTIDSGYRGEVGIIIDNISDSTRSIIEKGDRIAQGVLVPIKKARFIVKDELSETVRGDTGYGSSGQK